MIVIEVVEVEITCTGFALVVMSFPTQLNVVVAVKAGEIPLITAELEARVATPPSHRGVPTEVFGQVVVPVVAPQ